MDLNLKIIKKAKGYRAGKLLINNKFFAFTIEDEDRGLMQSMALNEINLLKKYGITAIPTGKYEIAFTYSDRFKRFMLQVLNVKGFDGIRIHVANSAKDVEGCIGVAYEDSSDGFAGNSANAIKELERICHEVKETEKIWLVIE